MHKNTSDPIHMHTEREMFTEKYLHCIVKVTSPSSWMVSAVSVAPERQCCKRQAKCRNINRTPTQQSKSVCILFCRSASSFHAYVWCLYVCWVSNCCVRVRKARARNLPLARYWTGSQHTHTHTRQANSVSAVCVLDARHKNGRCMVCAHRNRFYGRRYVQTRWLYSIVTFIGYCS